MTKSQIEETLRLASRTIAPAIYKTLLDSAQEAIFLVGPEDTLEYANEFASRFIPLPKEEIIGKHLKDLFPPEIYETQKASLRQVRDNLKPIYIEIKATANGQEFYLSISCAPIKDASGEVTAILGIGRDITQQKEKAARLENEYNQLISIFDSMDSVAYIVDPQSYEILYANRSLVDSLGDPLAPVLGKKCYQLFQNLEAPCQFCTNDRIFGENLGKTYIWDFQNRMNKRWYHCLDRAIRWPDGRMVRCEIATEITQRKKAEEALSDSEAKYRVVAENTYDWEFWLSPENRFIYISPSCKWITGYDSSEFLSDAGLLQRIIHPDDLALFNNHHSGVNKDLRSDLEFRIIHKDGTLRWLEHGCRPITDREGNFLGTRGANRDITRRKVAEAKINWLATFPELSPNSVMEIDFTGKIRYLNPMAQKLFPDLENSSLGHAFLEGWESVLGLFKNENRFAFNREIKVGGKWFLQQFYYLSQQGCVRIYGIDITDRKKSEEELRRHMEFERLISNLTTGFINLSSDQIDKGINQALKAISEFSGVDRSYIVLLSEDAKQASATHEWCAAGISSNMRKAKGFLVSDFPWFYQEMQNKKNVYIVDLDALPKEAVLEKEIFKNGSNRSTICVPITYDGIVIGFLGFDSVRESKIWSQETIDLLGIAGEMFANALKRKYIEEMLLESKEHYRAIVEDQTELICRFLPEGTLTFVNDAYCRYFGKKQGELIGSSFMLLIPEGDREKVRQNIVSISRDNPILSYECRVIDASGEIRWNQWTNRAIIGKDGLIKEFQGVGRDTTERRKSFEALREREVFLLSIFNSIQDGLSILDKDMNIVRVNPTIEKWYAHALPIIGKKCYRVYHGRNTPCETCPSIRAMQTAKAHYQTVPKRTKNRKITGWLDLYSFPQLDIDTGEIKGAIEYVRDITGQKRIEKKLELSNKALTETNAKLKQSVLRDPQTGLYNHRYLEEAIDAEFYRCRRFAHPFSVTMLDIDYFKSINEVYGHSFGDLILKQFARQLNKLVRKYDTAIRFGGEEFVVISPGIDRPTALFLAQKMLDAISLYNFGNNKHTVKVKLSIAVVAYPEDKIVKGMDLIALAEKITSKIKESGGNKVYSSLEINQAERVPDKKDKESPDIKFLKKKVERLTKKANQSLMEAVFAFARTIKVKDHYTGEHVEMTVQYATEIAKILDLSCEEIEQIRQAAMLHDLGKIGVSEKILLKKGKLSKSEFEEIKKHPQIGVDIIRPIQFLQNIIPSILYHHERWDGRGYPSGLKGEDIPIGARIVAIADVYQALSSDRPYRKAYSRQEALRIIRESSGTQFDPQIVNGFLMIAGQRN